MKNIYSTCLYVNLKWKWEYNNLSILIIRIWKWFELSLSICSIGKNQIRFLKSHSKLWNYFICPTRIWLVCKSLLVLKKIRNILHYMSVIFVLYCIFCLIYCWLVVVLYLEYALQLLSFFLINYFFICSALMCVDFHICPQVPRFAFSNPILFALAEFLG